jgi:hypothetical protein
VDYNFGLVYIAGEKNVVADTLSRRPDTFVVLLRAVDEGERETDGC